MAIDIFVREFKQIHWDNYVHLSKEYYDTSLDEVKALDELNIPEDIKVVLVYRLKGYAKDWLLKELPVIDGIKPINLLNSADGTKALKEILLRIPCYSCT